MGLYHCLDPFVVLHSVRLETFDEELMFDHEYDEEEGYEDEDSNGVL